MSEVQPTSFNPDPKLMRLLIHGCAKPDGLGLPPHYGPAEFWNPAWADRLALTAAWVIEHCGLHRPIKVQSAIVFRETRAAGPVWRVAPDGEYLSIQVVYGPRWVACTRWRIFDGSEVNDHGSPLLNQSMRLPTLAGQVAPDTNPEVALLNALDAAGFVKVAVEENPKT